MRRYVATSLLLVLNMVVFAEDKCPIEKGFEKVSVNHIKFKQVDKCTTVSECFRQIKYDWENGQYIFYKSAIDRDLVIKFQFYGQGSFYDVLDDVYVNKDHLAVGNIKIFNEETNELVKDIEIGNYRDKATYNSGLLEVLNRDKGMYVSVLETLDKISLGIFSEGIYSIEINLCLNSKLKPFYERTKLEYIRQDSK